MTRFLIFSLATAALGWAQDPPKPPKSQDEPGTTTTGPVEMPRPARFDRVGTFSDLILSPDGAFLYALDLRNTKVCKLKADDLTLAKELDAIEGVTCMSLTPDGKTLYVAGCDGAATVKQGGTGPFWGAIQVVGTTKFEVVTEFKLDGCPISDLVALDNGQLTAVCFGANKGTANTFVAIDGVNKKVLTTIDITHQGTGKGSTFDRPHIHMPPEQDRVYCTGDYSFIRLGLRKGPEQYDTMETARCHGKPMGKDFIISPGGEYIFSNGGCLFKTAGEWRSDIQFVWKVDAWLACAFPKDAKSFYVSREEGKIKQYDIDTKRAIASFRIQGECLQMVLDEKRRRLYCVTVPLADPQDPFKSRASSYEIVAYQIPR